MTKAKTFLITLLAMLFLVGSSVLFMGCDPAEVDEPVDEPIEEEPVEEPEVEEELEIEDPEEEMEEEEEGI